MDLVPDNLRRAHEDGDVVFFCGAGVSMPAGLPSFKGLVENVLVDLLPTRGRCEPGTPYALAWKALSDDRYDEALDILESPREGVYAPKNVRERVHHHLTAPDNKTLEKHLILARLADLDTSNGRLITTNFDHLFEDAQSELMELEGSSHEMVVHVSPALPPAKPETSCGLTYLHGKLGHSPDEGGLVLTTANFGTAYMLEGWARRFVIDLFRHYHVIFIGYRVEDPTMRYLVSAMAAAREEKNRFFKEAYAFAPFGENEDEPDTKEEAEQEWNMKGLTPLAYYTANGHRELWQELEEWADDHRQGITGRWHKVALRGKSPPVDENDDAIREIVWALKEPAVAKYFASLTGEDCPNPGWIAPLQKAGLLSYSVGKTEEGEPIKAPLVSHRLSDSLDVHEVTFHLARWVASCVDSKEARDWVLAEGGVLHWHLRWQVQDSLKNAGDSIPSALRKLWQVLANDGYAHALSAKGMRPFPNYSSLSPGNSFAVQDFLGRLRPIPVFKVWHSFFGDQNDPDPERPQDWYEINIELVGIDGKHDIEQFRKSAEDWEGALALMADDITSRLKEAMDWLQEFGLASPSEDPTPIEYRSISPHGQNEHAHVWTQLIVLVRDSYDALMESGDIAAAARLCRRWQALPYPIFRRLALYAATGGRNA